MKPLFILDGKVIQGQSRGKSLGFPTANIQVSKQIPEGIYAAEVVVKGQTFQAATFIGASKTFGEDEYKAESYILDFDKDIYGQVVTVKLYKKLRDNKAFDSSEALQAQMTEDIKAVQKFFLDKTQAKV